LPGGEFYPDALDQAQKAANDGDVPLVVVHKAMDDYKNALVVMNIMDFKENFLDEENNPKRFKTVWHNLDS